MRGLKDCITESYRKAKRRARDAAYLERARGVHPDAIGAVTQEMLLRAGLALASLFFVHCFEEPLLQDREELWPDVLERHAHSLMGQ